MNGTTTHYHIFKVVSLGFEDTPMSSLDDFKHIVIILKNSFIPNLNIRFIFGSHSDDNDGESVS